MNHSRHSPFWYRPAFYVVLAGALILMHGIALKRLRPAQPTSAPAVAHTDATQRAAAMEARLSRQALGRALTGHPPLLLALGVLLVAGLCVMLLGIILDLRWLGRWRELAAFLHATHPPGPSAWALSDIGRMLILILWWVSVFPFVEAGYTWLLRLPVEEGLAGMLISSTYLYGLLALMIVLLARAKQPTTTQRLGLQPAASARVLQRGVAAYVALVPCLVILLMVSARVAARLGYEPPAHPLSLLFLEEQRLWVLSYGVVFTCLLAPAAEELLFRAVLFPALRSRMSFWLAAGISGLGFGLLHANWVSVLPIAWLGVLLAYLYETTGSLYASILVHALHNGVMVVLIFLYRALMQAVGGSL